MISGSFLLETLRNKENRRLQVCLLPERDDLHREISHTNSNTPQGIIYIRVLPWVSWWCCWRHFRCAQSTCCSGWKRRRLLRNYGWKKGGSWVCVFVSQHFKQDVIEIDQLCVYYSDHDLLHVKIKFKS